MHDNIYTFVTVHSSASCTAPLGPAVPVLLVVLLLLDALLSSRTRPPRCQIPEAAGSPPPRLCTTHSPRCRAGTTLLLLLEEHSGRRRLRERSDGAPWKPAAGTKARAKGVADASMDTAHELQALMVWRMQH